MKPLFHSFTSAAIALLGLLAASPTFAQTGKTGTTIRMDGTTCHPLYSDGATGTSVSGQYFSFLRHDISHVQIVASNASTLSSNGTGDFAEEANDMLFTNDANKYLQIFNRNGSSDPTYYAIIAPKGYRFTRYQWEIDASKSTTGTSLTQYTYNGDEVQTTSNTMKVAADMGVWDVTLNNGSNVLYFQYDPNGNTEAKELVIKSLKLTYVIDDPFTAALPSSDGTTGIHTGILDPGTFSYSTEHPTVWSYDRKNGITDTQLANLYENGTKVAPKVATVENGDHYFLAAANGDYYVEAPEKFRVVGATLHFLRSDAKLNDGEVTTTKPEYITSGSSYAISDGNGHYLVRNGSSLSVTNDSTKATKWTISGNSSYTIKDDAGYYLCISYSRSWGSSYYYYNLGVTTSTSSYRYTSWTLDSGRGLKNSSVPYYLTYESGWTIASSTSNYANPVTVTTSDATTTTAGDFTATPYTRDNNENKAEAKELTEGNADATVELKDFNNDAIHFNISGLADGCSALYSVDLQLMPLNPELQNLSVASRVGDTNIPNTQSFSAENYEFNGGNDVVVTVPTGSETCSVVFQNAVNENRTQWYTNGSNENSTEAGGYSNYFLVNSTADKSKGNNNAKVELNIEAKNNPGDRTSATQAGTKKLLFTNIDKIYTISSSGSFGPGEENTLKDNAFSKTEAGYADVTLTTNAANATTCYVYVADQPTWNILPNGNQHIDFRYFTLNIRSKSEDAKPVVTLTPLYTKTLKSQNHKNSSIASDGNTLDEKHTYYGVKVTAQVNGKEGSYALSSQNVVDAIKDALAKEAINYGGFGENDAFRGVLYIDMSALESVDETAFDDDFHNSTADNCLYFMYKGFNRHGITNAVAIKADGTFEAVSNIKVYDQQPFFTPYDFVTGSYTASYERESTHGKALVKNMAVTLPFDVQLNGEGKLKTAGDVTDNAVTYHRITGSGELTGIHKGDGQELTYAVVATPVTDNTANANEAYYVTTENEGFTYNIAGARFHATPGLETLSSQNGTWTSVGTYAGVTPDVNENLWYFAKELFWKSSNLKPQYNVVYVLPFRAYFTTTDNTGSNLKATWTNDESDVVPTGINDLNANKAGLQIVGGHGCLTVSSDADAIVRVFTVAGQLVANEDITAGETLRMSVPQGVYLVNGTKVVVR